MLGDSRSVHVQRLALGLARRGHTVHILCHKPVAVAGVTVERFSVPRPGLTNLCGWRGRVARYLRRVLQGFDVVNVQFLGDWGLTPEIKQHGCVVASPWGSDVVPPPGETPPSVELFASRVALLRSADAVTAWGPTFARTIAQFAGINVDDVHIAPLGVDLALFDPEKHQGGRTRGTCRVGFFKGFREVYGASYLVRAIPIILNRLPETEFDLVGEGPHREACKELAARLDVDSAINWVPAQPYHRVPRFLAMWDVTAIPSLCESFGAAALESSAMCVPVVASNVGGLVGTVRDKETGLLVPPRSPSTLADAIISLLRDNERRTRMGRAGRCWVEEAYEWSHVLGQWESVFTRAHDHATAMV